MIIPVKLSNKEYNIIQERSALQHIGEYADINRKVMVVSDTGVPKQYVDTVLAQCPQGFSHIIPQGEGSKSLEVYKEICQHLLECNFSRKDLIIALGGGVIGDLAGFVASTYMRGISFVNIPTTTLSQIDSSIGGKVAVDLDNVKNIVGAFHHPDVVIIDSDTLSTLSKRHFNNGLVEAVKAGLIYDKDLFDIFENSDNLENEIDNIIYRCLLVKRAVVQQDEKEENIRKILNFGHTIGHGIESADGLAGLLHGECVAIGMLPMLEDDELRKRVLSVYKKLELKTKTQFDTKTVMDIMLKDKKAYAGKITIVKVKTAGKAFLCDIQTDGLIEYLDMINATEG